MKIYRWQCVVLHSAALTLLYSANANAGVADDLALCRGIVDKDQRVKCYDKVSAEQTSKTANVSGGWIIQEDVDPLTRKAKVTGLLMSSTGVSRFGRSPTLIARCANNETDLYISWNDYLGNDGVKVTWRLGDMQPITETWTNSSDHKASFSKKAISMLRSMRDQSEFVASTTPYNESPVTAVFDISNNGVLIDKISTMCGWK